MKKNLKITGLLCALLCSCVLAGCGNKEAETEADNGFNTEAEVLADTAAPEETPEETSEEETAPAERQVVDGKIRSYFTGEWIDETLGKQRPLAIMLNNTSAALPMSGVSNASVIYECPVEGRITRWMGVFEDWENLERIGSVRSCRL